jgi:hypothetical protein
LNRLFVPFMALAFAGTQAMYGVTMNIYASPAPNAYGSPSFAGWETNVINALLNGQTSAGNPAADPTAFYTLTNGDSFSNIVTGFPSWDGQANPGTVFGPAFSNELGNRLHFPVIINGQGTKISLSELSFDMESTDSNDIFKYTGGFSSLDNYDDYHLGVILGPSGPTFLNSGSADQPVDEIVYRGIGNAIAPNDIGCSGTNQQQLDCVTAFYNSTEPFSITAKYSLNDPTGALLASDSATVEFAAPEPGTISLLFAGAGVLFYARRRFHA